MTAWTWLSPVLVQAGSGPHIPRTSSVAFACCGSVCASTRTLLGLARPDAKERTTAIGIWSGISGLGVAIGPTAGGALLAHFSWSSVFLINLPIVLLALVAGRRFVPASRSEQPPRLDPVGAALSIASVSLLAEAVIEAPGHGFLSLRTVAVAALAVLLGAGFVGWEQHTDEPMVEFSLFRNLRFTAASVSITIVFFSLFGALFLLTQILQFVLGYSTLHAGVAALPFAATVGITSPLAASVAKRFGNKLPVSGGLVAIAAGLSVMATATASSGYPLFLAATVLMAAGMGFAMAPATDAIMGALPAEKAGVGSAINDTTRELGSVFGVAVLGSITSAAYLHGVTQAARHLPAPLASIARQSLAGALAVAHHAPAAIGGPLAAAAREAFVTAADRGVIIAAAVALLGAVFAWRALPARAAAAESTVVAGSAVAAA